MFLIEVNPNPHLAPDSEQPAAAARHGLSYGALIDRLVDNAMTRQRR